MEGNKKMKYIKKEDIREYQNKGRCKWKCVRKWGGDRRMKEEPFIIYTIIKCRNIQSIGFKLEILEIGGDE